MQFSDSKTQAPESVYYFRTWQLQGFWVYTTFGHENSRPWKCILCSVLKTQGTGSDHSTCIYNEHSPCIMSHRAHVRRNWDRGVGRTKPQGNKEGGWEAARPHCGWGGDGGLGQCMDLGGWYQLGRWLGWADAYAYVNNCFLWIWNTCMFDKLQLMQQSCQECAYLSYCCVDISTFLLSPNEIQLRLAARSWAGSFAL